jgi:RNA polymerase sigma-70 factor, ECF subfamily
MRVPWSTRRSGSDEQFLAAIEAEHGRALRAYLRGRWRDADQVEDLMQEVLLRAWRSVGSLRSSEATDRQLRGWLLTTAHNVLVDRWRADRRRPASPVDQDALIALAPATAPLDRVLDTWLVQEALSRLSVEHRTVVVEMHHNGRSVAEIAELLGIAEGTVKSRSYYAVRALRSIFDELGVTR